MNGIQPFYTLDDFLADHLEIPYLILDLRFEAFSTLKKPLRLLAVASIVINNCHKSFGIIRWRIGSSNA